MTTNNMQEAQQLKAFLEKIEDISGKEKLIKRLEIDTPSDGDIFHAKVVKLIFESKQFNITVIELSENGKDIDIQVIDIKTGKKINIQCWRGNAFSTYEVTRAVESKNHLQEGVPTNWDKDKEKIVKKLNQLPDSETGVVICLPENYGDLESSWMLSELEGGFPKNKVLVELDNGTSEIRGAVIHAPSDFKEYEIVERIINSLKSTIRNKIEH